MRMARHDSVRSSRFQHGFTLLEAIVAMTLFALAAFSLYAWLNANLHTLARVEAGRDTLAVQHSALELVRTINPMREPEGRREVGPLVVAWQAHPLLPPTDGKTALGALSLFEVGLYQVDVAVWSDGRALPGFAIRQVGWRQVRTIDRD
ncbi:MAG TPA: hypothetical protein DDZ76_08340 [Xanthomonadales bacterium]|nr:hypothetical protein [Xanthomonadales bacterium]